MGKENVENKEVKQEVKKEEKETFLFVKKEQQFLNEEEMKFYQELNRICEKMGLEVMCKVSVSKVLKPEFISMNKDELLNEIKDKVFDFVVIHPETFEPLYAFSYHQRESYPFTNEEKNYEKFISEASKRMKLPIINIVSPLADSYKELLNGYVKNQLEFLIKGVV